MRAFITALVLLTAGGATQAPRLDELMAAAKVLGEVPMWENAYVRVYGTGLEYPPADRQIAEARPVVLYVRVEPGPGAGETRLLEAPQGVRHSSQPRPMPRGIRVELLATPPAPPTFGEPGTDPPRDSIIADHERYRLVLATLQPQHYGEGAGRLPSVTIILSDGVLDVWNRGVRRRVGVRAGDAFWIEPFTRLTVMSDDPVGAAIVQVRTK